MTACPPSPFGHRVYSATSSDSLANDTTVDEVLQSYVGSVPAAQALMYAEHVFDNAPIGLMLS